PVYAQRLEGAEEAHRLIIPMTVRLIAVVALLAFANSRNAAAQTAAPVTDTPHGSACAALTAVKVPDVRISAAQPPAAGTSWTGSGTAAPPIATPKSFCRVQGIIETEIAFELWLPAPADW